MKGRPKKERKEKGNDRRTPLLCWRGTDFHSTCVGHACVCTGVCMSVCNVDVGVWACMRDKVECGKERANRRVKGKVRILMRKSLTRDFGKSRLGQRKETNHPRTRHKTEGELPRTMRWCVFLQDSTGFVLGEFSTKLFTCEEWARELPFRCQVYTLYRPFHHTGTKTHTSWTIRDSRRCKWLGTGPQFHARGRLIHTLNTCELWR